MPRLRADTTPPTMQIPRLPVLALLSVLVLGCTSHELEPTPLDDIMVATAVKEGAGFDGKGTYAWQGLVSDAVETGASWKEPQPSVVAEIKRAVDKKLAARKMKETAESPSFHAYYGTGVDMTAVSLVDGSGGTLTKVDQMAKVGMCIILVDAASGDRVWAGVATGDIDWSATNERMSERIQFAVDKMFKDFPN